MARKRYYDKRQIIDVTDYDTIDFDEQILICVPKFAWVVARSWLSLQAQWDSTYAIEYFTNGYETPSAEQMDVINANLADFLGEYDMSCDLEAVLQQMADIMQEMLEKECTANLSCTVGSSGAGGSEADPESWEDDGSDPPPGFPTYPDYEDFKCGVATLIVESLIKDIQYVKATPFTEYAAVFLAAALLSPIPGDEIAVLVGALLALVAEAALDVILDDIIAAVEANKDDLICDFYEAANVAAAKAVMTTFSVAFLSGPAQYIFSFWSANDNMNLLFKVGNFFLPTADCSGCAAPTYEVRDTFTDVDGTPLLDHTPEEGGPWLVQVGNWSILGNQAYHISSSGARVLIDGVISESLASFTLTPASTSNKSAYQGLIVRADGTGNYISGGWKGGASPGYYIAKRVSGSFSVEEWIAAPEDYSDKEILIKCEGTFINLYVDGAPTLEMDDAFNITETEYGLEFGQAGQARGDDFMVQPIT